MLVEMCNYHMNPFIFNKKYMFSEDKFKIKKNKKKNAYTVLIFR